MGPVPPGDAVTARRAIERFWLDFTMAPQALRLFRLLFFAVLALDMWLEMSHAPRYGAGDFNVSHLPALDGILPVPGRAFMVALFAVSAYLAALTAFAGARRPVLIALASLFGVFYFSSQLDSYQHHYLMFLVLVILCFADWRKGGWPLRLLLVQLSILYFYAAVSKMPAEWRGGQVLAAQVQEDWARAFIERLGGFGKAAKLVIATELFLAGAIQVRALRPVAAAVGIPFHLFIELSGFQIGLFSYFMLALYALMLPERPVVWLVDRWDHATARLLARPIGLVRGGVLVAVGVVVMITLPIGVAAAAGATAAAVVGGWLVWRAPAGERARAAFGHALACIAVALVAMPAFTDAARDHYRYWGGSARRLGDLDGAVTAYERAVELDPDFAQGHTSLANLYRRTGALDDAAREAAAAQALAPDDYRPFLVGAMVHDQTGNGLQALDAAERALALQPGEPDAERIAAKWRAQLGRPGPSGSGPGSGSASGSGSGSGSDDEDSE
ncbi:MAG TPA: HTTM domain-containing protein [Kofleriaceae bacterium]|nr:HTTM domain-containing protein [Kofleriaceae bacterium]